jgi:hypothetical protein
VAKETADRLRDAQIRLQRALDAYEAARREDSRLKTPATKDARDRAVVELQLATRKLTEVTGKLYGM